MRPARILHPCSSGSEPVAISKLLPFMIALGVFLTAAFQAPFAFAQISLSPQPLQRISVCPQPNLAPPKNALVIFVEENTSQSFSVSWRGMSNVLQRMGTINLFPPEVRSLVDTFVRNLQNISPQTNVITDIEIQLRKHVAQMTKEMVRRGRNLLGLPGAGCIGGVLDTLGRLDLRVGEDIYKVFMDTYGEAGLSNCLREMASPYYDHVEVLTDQGASFQNFRDTLLRLHRCGFTIDVLMDGHGCGQNISMNNKSCGTPGLCFYNPSNPSISDRRDAQQIQQLKVDNGNQNLRLNAVYMTSCWGSEFNQAWINIGAKASNGPQQLDYYVLLSPFLFLDGFTRGDKTLKAAAKDAYDIEKALLNVLPSYRVEVDLRPKLNELFPIRYTGTEPCGVNMPWGYLGLSTKIDYRGFGDYCVGDIFDYPKTCPLGSTKVIQQGEDKCKQDLLGPLRDQAHWSFDLGFSIDRALAVTYGANPAQPVDNKASSQRIQLGSSAEVSDVRQANVCRKNGIGFCFGASGQFCGGLPFIPFAAQLGEAYWGCAGNNCVINAGSWVHDQCCAEYPEVGRFCGPAEKTAFSKVCWTETDRAGHRLAHRLSWKRRVNTCTPNGTGIVNHAEYCAPAGTIVAKEDAPMCCSRMARAFNPQDAGDQGLARAQRVIFDPSYVPAVCTQP